MYGSDNDVENEYEQVDDLFGQMPVQAESPHDINESLNFNYNYDNVSQYEPKE